jgi:succinate dehydrogenase/fumarate reductase cytochrome b subunit
MKSDAQIKERRLLLTQVISGLLFSVFLLVHLCNQMLGSLGPATYDGAQQMLRRGYQAPVIELLLVCIPAIVHAVAGVLRMLHRRKQGRSAPAELRARFHRISGMFLLVVFLGHSLATRGPSLFAGVFPGFEGLSFTFRSMPYVFWPYYTMLALCGLYHVMYGLSVALPIVGFSRASTLRKPAVLFTIFAIGGLLLVLGLMGMGGVFFDVGCPEAGAFAQLYESLGLTDLSYASCLK